MKTKRCLNMLGGHSGSPKLRFPPPDFAKWSKSRDKASWRHAGERNMRKKTDSDATYGILDSFISFWIDQDTSVSVGQNQLKRNTYLKNIHQENIIKYTHIKCTSRYSGHEPYSRAEGSQFWVHFSSFKKKALFLFSKIISISTSTCLLKVFLISVQHLE
jgi:hypothetical protein